MNLFKAKFKTILHKLNYQRLEIKLVKRHQHHKYVEEHFKLYVCCLRLLLSWEQRDLIVKLLIKKYLNRGLAYSCI
jgi:hypothetical protein